MWFRNRRTSRFHKLGQYGYSLCKVTHQLPSAQPSDDSPTANRGKTCQRIVKARAGVNSGVI